MCFISVVLFIFIYVGKIDLYKIENSIVVLNGENKFFRGIYFIY